MAIRGKLVEQLALTVDAIATSSRVDEYIIGYTARQGLKRRSEYVRRHGYEYLVILVDRLTQADALKIEQALHEYLTHEGNPDLLRHTASYRKYEKKRLHERHYRSAGNFSADPNDIVHSVYMAWRG